MRDLYKERLISETAIEEKAQYERWTYLEFLTIIPETFASVSGAS
jgi:hypothetical protein